MVSDIYHVNNVPIPDFTESNYHQGIDSLLNLMSEKEFKIYKSNKNGHNAGPGGLIASNDLVLLKLNAQWKHRGMTNVDVVRGLIQRILDHPDGFKGEVVIFENGQGRGSLNCDMCDQYYSTGEVAANAENPSHTWLWLIDRVFGDAPVSAILFDEYYDIKVPDDDHESQGYRFINPHPERHNWSLSYPVFNTIEGKRVDFRKGIWTGRGYDDSKLKLISIPVMKNHRRAGVTGVLKLYFGILSIHWHSAEYHDNIGLTCAEMFTHLRSPDLNILDSIWVSINNVNGHPDTHPQRANQLTASTDPLALDYWAAKNIIYPLSRNPLHNPDEPLKFRMMTLLPAKHEFDQCGGPKGKQVTMDECEIRIHKQRM